MIKRKIIKIDENLCNGCCLCVDACHEGAIAMVDGKAKLLRDDYCDGLGDCLPICPTGAISFEVRDALAYDEEAVQENIKKRTNGLVNASCPGKKVMLLEKEKSLSTKVADREDVESQLEQWPVQIKLVPVNAPYFDNANLLIAADCTAFAFANFHSVFMKGKITLIGCPKLDECEYSEKLGNILKMNNIKSITVVRMEVPCCSGLTNAVITALKNSGKIIPWQVSTISVNGEIVEN